MSEKILLIGGAGFIGSCIARKLVAQKDRVVIFDSFIQYLDPLSSDYESSLKSRFDGFADKVEIIRGDVRNYSDLTRVLTETRPDRIVHLAHMPISTMSNVYVEEAIESCVNSTAKIIDVIRNLDLSIKRFLYTSSSMIYGDFQFSNADENHPKNPKGVYGGAKLAGEIITKTMCKQYGIDYTIIRPSAVYGPTDTNNRVTQIFVDNAMKGIKLVVKGGKETKLDFTFVEDVADGFILALFSENAVNEIFNITYGQARSIFEYANQVKQFCPDTEIELKPHDKQMPKRGTLSIDKAKKLLGYSPKVSIEKGIEIYLRFKGFKEATLKEGYKN